MNRYW